MFFNAHRIPKRLYMYWQQSSHQVDLFPRSETSDGMATHCDVTGIAFSSRVTGPLRKLIEISLLARRVKFLYSEWKCDALKVTDCVRISDFSFYWIKINSNV